MIATYNDAIMWPDYHRLFDLSELTSLSYLDILFGHQDRDITLI